MTNIVMLIGPGRYRLTQQALESLGAHTDRSSISLTLVLDEVDFRTEYCCKNVIDFVNGWPQATMLKVSRSGHTLSQLKNIGVAWSEQRFGRGDWLYISDSDVYFTDGWLEKLTAFAESTESDDYRLWGGQIHPFHASGVQVNGKAYLQVLDGPSWLMRWGGWDHWGPFDRTTAPGVCQSEEYPFCERLLNSHGRIGVIHPHCVFHCGITNSNGHPAPGWEERLKGKPEGVLYE